MSSPMDTGGHQSDSPLPKMTSSDERPPIFTGLGAVSESEEGRGDVWSQGDVTKHSGSVWKGGVTVVLNVIARPLDKREREKGFRESGGLLNSRENIHRIEIRGGGDQGEAGSGSLRRSSRPKSNWTPHPKEDPCERMRVLGVIRYSDIVIVFGGVTVQERTQRRAFESFSTLHQQQHEMEGVQKFQYSVQVGSEGVNGSSDCLIPHDDVPLLLRLTGQGHRNLRTLTGEGRESVGLGQYAQHSCCFDQVNAHIFPMFTLREQTDSTDLRQGEDGEWIQFQGE